MTTTITAKQQRLTVTVNEAAAMLGVSRGLAYEQIRDGRFPVAVARIGNRILVPRAPLLRLLGAEERSD